MTRISLTIAFRKWVRKLYGWEVEVRVESMLEDSSRIARFNAQFHSEARSVVSSPLSCAGRRFELFESFEGDFKEKVLLGSRSEL